MLEDNTKIENDCDIPEFTGEGAIEKNKGADDIGEVLDKVQEQFTDSQDVQEESKPQRQLWEAVLDDVDSQVLFVPNKKSERIYSGDIYKNVTHVEWFAKNQTKNKASISVITFPYVIVLSQDCDLCRCWERARGDSPQKCNSILMSVLVAPLHNKDILFSGEHLLNIGYRMASIEASSNKNKKKGPGGPQGKIIQNQDTRYHYLKFPESVDIPESVVDFKHYFTVNIQELDAAGDRLMYTVPPVFREDIAQRFACYFSRIALPGSEMQSDVEWKKIFV